MGKIFGKTKRSISSMLFLIIFMAINAVLIVGFLLVSLFAPVIYCNYTMHEIKKSVCDTVERYEIDLRLVHNELNEESDTYDDIDSGDMTYQQFFVFFFNSSQNQEIFSQPDELKELLGDEEYSSLMLNYVMSSLSMSKASKIDIKSNEGELIYNTPSWFMQSIKGLRKESEGRSEQLYFLQNKVEESQWISTTSYLDIGDGYWLKVSLDVSDFVQNMVIIRRLFLYLMIVGAIFAIIFASFLSNRVTKPLKELRGIAQKMENMDFTLRYEGTRGDEIGELGRTLNHMMDRLNETIKKLKGELDKEKQADVLRKEFIAQVSHELKTPVSVISNYVEALQDGMAESYEEQDAYYSVIDKECRKIGHIINDLLDLSQMEAGTFKVEIDNFDITQLVNSIVDKYSEVVPDGIDMVKEIADEEIEISGDAIRIEQVIENLMTNAIKHTESGSLIKVSSRLEGKMVHIQIENEGEGIDEDLRLHIWESFVKGENEPGAGIGLSIVNNIIRLHNGECYTQNKESSVIFGIRLPIKE